MPDTEAKYFMTISLNVLNHMGLNLYSNTPAVVAEVIANSWDADATSVDVDFDIDNKTINVTDDGCGMSLEDVNGRYLYVGYQKRPEGGQDEFLTPLHHRRPMGRKGIGKLSLFSIANTFRVYTRKQGAETEAFLMDADKIREPIEIGRHSGFDQIGMLDTLVNICFNVQHVPNARRRIPARGDGTSRRPCRAAFRRDRPPSALERGC